ncbi:MAG: hypothetical protein ACKO2P_08400 [Planctomycetota bacterium]
MLSGKLSVGAALGLLCCSLSTSTAQAQFFGANNCNCAPVQPAMAACYQTIPVTSYVPEKQTVEVPTYETAYRTQEVTVWRPQTETKQVEIPTVTYQNVTEYQTVNRDMGRWITRYHPVAKCAPCQIDPRPGVIGWLNRTGYSMRTAFMPNYTTSREYVPNLVAFNVPVTRQVAIRGTQRVAVQETRMVAEKRDEQVPYQRLVMRREERTVMRPETAWRTVPIGTATAWGPWGATQTVYALPSTESSRTAATPQPDDRFRERSARKPAAASTETDLAPVSPSAAGSEPSFEPPAYERPRPLPADANPVPQTRSTRPADSSRSDAVSSHAASGSWKASRRPRSAALADAAVTEGLSLATADAP